MSIHLASRVLTPYGKHGTVVAIISKDEVSVLLDGRERPTVKLVSELTPIGGLRAQQVVAGAKVLAARLAGKRGGETKFWTERMNPAERSKHLRLFESALISVADHRSDALAGPKELARQISGSEGQSGALVWAGLDEETREDYQKTWFAMQTAAARA